MNLHPSIYLALAASLMYGIAAPMIKVTGQAGASTSGLLMVYGLGLIVVSFLYLMVSKNQITLGSQGAVFIISLGAVLGLACLTMFAAFGQRGASVSVVITLASMGPVITAFIEILFMDASSRVRPGMVLLAACLAVATAVTATMSVKPQ